MKKSSLLELLKSFSHDEIKEFDEFVRSPFFNKNESVVKYFELLKKYHPDFPENKIAKNEVFKKLFPGMKYNDGFMRKLSFQLSRLGEQYLSYKANNDNSIRSQYNFMLELLNRNLSKNYRKHIPSIIKENEQTKYKDYGYYQNRFLIESLITTAMDRLRYKMDLNDKKALYNEHAVEKLKWLTEHFIMLSLNSYRFLNYQSLYNQVEFNDEIMDDLINSLINDKITLRNRKNELMENPIIKLHVNEILLLKNKSKFNKLSEDKYYHILKHILYNEKEKHLHDSRFSLYNILHQHCYFKILRGYNEYMRERFELDKYAIKEGIYKSASEDHFPPPAFAYFVRDAAEVNQTDWALKFINNYRDRLEQVNFDTVVNLSYAHYYFGKKEFSKALEYLNKIKPIKRLEFKFGVKELTSMIFYELSMFSEAYYLVDTFRHFISSMEKHFSPERTISRNNFLKYYQKLLKMKEKKTQKGLTEIQMDLADHNLPVISRSWLEEKIAELEK